MAWNVLNARVLKEDIPVMYSLKMNKSTVLLANRASIGVLAQTYYFLSVTTDHQDTIIDYLQ